MRGCVSVREDVSYCRKVRPGAGVCGPVWEGLSQCVRVCPNVGGCVPL